MALKISKVKYVVHIIVMAIFLLIWSVCVFADFKQNALFYRYLLNNNLEGRRVAVNYYDFYRFIVLCNNDIPKDEDVAWVLNKKDKALSRSLAMRLHYYLLPRNFRRQANYILVYELPGYKREGYEVYKEYVPGKFILKRKK